MAFATREKTLAGLRVAAATGFSEVIVPLLVWLSTEDTP
jgi:hypothetical protein